MKANTGGNLKLKVHAYVGAYDLKGMGKVIMIIGLVLLFCCLAIFLVIGVVACGAICLKQGAKLMKGVGDNQKSKPAKSPVYENVVARQGGESGEKLVEAYQTPVLAPTLQV